MSSPTFRKAPRETVDFASPPQRTERREEADSIHTHRRVLLFPRTHHAAPRAGPWRRRPSPPLSATRTSTPVDAFSCTRPGTQPRAPRSRSGILSLLPHLVSWHRSVKLFGVLVDPVVVNFGCFCSASRLLETIVVAASNATCSFHLENRKSLANYLLLLLNSIRRIRVLELGR